MSSNTWTSTDLVSDVLLMSHSPTGNNTFTPAQILRLATIELQTPIMKQILSTRGGYYLTYKDYATASDGLYGIPSDAIAGSLANVELVQDTTIIQVNPLEEPEQYSTTSPTSTSYGHFMKGNYVQILPIPNLGVTRLWYFKRTSDIIRTLAACQVTAVNGAVISVSSIPSTIIIGSYVDVLTDQPPFNLLQENVQISGITGTDITLPAAVTGLSIGDWIALNGQTPIPQVPVEYRLILAQRVVCKMYELQGYLDKLNSAKAVLKEYEADTMGLITPRVKSATKIVMAVNGGFLAGQNRMTNFPAGKLP